MNTLEQWRFEADGGDWADVLQRAGRSRARWVLAAAVAVLVLAAPAVADVVTHAIQKGHGQQLVATLRGPDGQAGGTFAMSPRVMIAVSRKSHPRLFANGPRVEVAWKLQLDRDGTASSLRLVGRRGLKRTLCAPCTAGNGRAEFPLRGAVFLFGPHSGVRAVVDGTTLSGRLKFQR